MSELSPTSPPTLAEEDWAFVDRCFPGFCDTAEDGIRTWEDELSVMSLGWSEEAGAQIKNGYIIHKASKMDGKLNIYRMFTDQRSLSVFEGIVANHFEVIEGDDDVDPLLISANGITEPSAMDVRDLSLIIFDLRHGILAQ